MPPPGCRWAVAVPMQVAASRFNFLQCTAQAFRFNLDTDSSRTQAADSEFRTRTVTDSDSESWALSCHGPPVPLYGQPALGQQLSGRVT